MADFLAVEQVFGFLAALGGGLLVGVQRERQKDRHASGEPAGVRTFTVVALIGAIAAHLGASTQWMAGFAVTAMAIAAYLQRADRDPGLTTEAALLATYLLGAFATAAPAFSAALFVVLAALLETKQALHHFTRNVLSERELGDALLLAASVLIVLPLLPDRTFDAYAVLNPRRIWLFAVLVMAINGAGYIALRVFGSRRGLLLAGFFGGFISSTATIASMGQRARETPGVRRTCIAAALLSNVATVVQLGLVLLATAPATLQRLGFPLAAAGVAAIFVGTASAVRGDGAAASDPPRGRPFDLGQAVVFALVVAAATGVAALLRGWMGRGGVVLAATATGFADVHAAAISLAQVNSGADSDSNTFAYALAAAFVANSIMKSIAAGAGGRDYALPLIGGIAVISAVLLGTVWATS
ncbi:MAG TPA: DUF4010 domain-containing protein [Rudaea sp.]|nr:DUF4010 domain-containing protein [Rudaea sp.]